MSKWHEEICTDDKAIPWIAASKSSDQKLLINYQLCRRTDRYKCSRADTADEWAGDGWYRFTGSAGTMLATSEIAKYGQYCDFSAPGYMKGGVSALPER